MNKIQFTITLFLSLNFTWYQTARIRSRVSVSYLSTLLLLLMHFMASSSSSFSIHPTTFSYQLPIKLNHDNYLSWKYFILSHAKGHDLLGFLDGSRPPPTATIVLSDGSSSPNPEYIAWARQDQLLLAWLLSTISVVPQVVHCVTSSDLWKELHLRYSSQSLARGMDLKL
jgi:hypothetical protein